MIFEKMTPGTMFYFRFPGIIAWEIQKNVDETYTLHAMKPNSIDVMMFINKFDVVTRIHGLTLMGLVVVENGRPMLYGIGQGDSLDKFVTVMSEC